MKPYGVKRKDQGCCPGHDKFPYESYGSRVSMKLKRRTDQLAHRRARSWERQEIFKELNDIFNMASINKRKKAVNSYCNGSLKEKIWRWNECYF